MTKQSSSGNQREALRQRVGLALLEMLRMAEDLRGQAARQQRLHPTDFACISYLSVQDLPVSPKQIVTRLGLTSGSGTALLDRLEQAGYIRRVPNPNDRRSVLIELDRQAAAEPIARYQRMQSGYRLMTDGFSDDELGVVARFLEKLGDPSLAERDAQDGGDAAAARASR